MEALCAEVFLRSDGAPSSIVAFSLSSGRRHSGKSDLRKNYGNDQSCVNPSSPRPSSSMFCVSEGRMISADSERKRLTDSKNVQ
jgi:hypothetical protein